MAIHITELQIDAFRGIRDVKVAGLNHVNVISGDNNSGKTSILEAISLLCAPDEFLNLYQVSRIRNQYSIYSSSSLYEAFLDMFPKDKPKPIAVSARYGAQTIAICVEGKTKKIAMDRLDVEHDPLLSDARKNQLKKSDIDFNNVSVFDGVLVSERKGIKLEQPFVLKEYDTISYMEKDDNVIDMHYLSPIDHITGTHFDAILVNDTYKQICIKILQVFDSGISDLLWLKSSVSNEKIEYIAHKTLGNMPLSTYGDGIKKILALADAIAIAANGVLLIDEIETAIHSKYYNDIFGFIEKAALQFDVQVFVTSHSIEAIDGFLHTQNYDEQAEKDNISVLTFKKSANENKTLVRVLTGRETYKNRENFDFEVRL